MKVKVSMKTSPKAQERYYEQVIAEAYAENERLYQENRDLERKIVILERDAKIAEERYQRTAQACDHWNSMAVEKIVELDEKCAAYADALRTVRQRENLINELNDQIEATESELKHANEVIMSINDQLERAEIQNVALQDHVDSLEFDNAELTAECARLRALEIDLAEARASAKQSSELAALYFEKWNALKQQDVRAQNFAKALISAIEKTTANDTAIVISEIE